MKKLAQLDGFKEKVDKEIEIFFAKTIAETRKRDKLVADSLEYVKKMAMAGGKRLRPALMYYGYLSAGGKEKEKILKASISIELIHIFLLIHDDIIDRDNLRHGIDTIQARYEKLGKKFFKNTDCAHFGNSMAIVIGDMVGALGNQVIFDSKFKSDLIMRALSKLQSIISMTVIGQVQDIYIEHKGKATEEQILQMYENKTAKYTIEGPLHLGAILGEADQKSLDALSSYAIPIGIAFQIQDDILGVFGSEKKMGKKVGSDIASGKQTILVAKAMQRADRKQKKELDKILGKKNLTKNDIKEFQSIIKNTGSLDFAKKLSRGLIFQGKNELESVAMDTEAKKFLEDIADFMIEREL